jgi:putative ubiquitin-RnfH superfamily antitoxin RatB of RatAB toxin-antitoxin module
MHSINIEIIYALPNLIWRKLLIIPRGSTPLDVIKESGFHEEFPQLEPGSLSYGIYSKRVDENYLLSEGDRLEIYRKLTADPKTVRREMAKVGKTMTDSR